MLISLGPIILTGLFISVLHSAMPTHWLPFVLAAKSQKWSWQKTQSILFIAGFGHVAMTTLIGSLIFALGLGLFHQLQQYFMIFSIGSISIYALLQIYQYKAGKKHSHCDHTHEHEHFDDLKSKATDGWAILSLLSLLTFSPCESFLPVYLSAASFGWQGFVVLSLTLAIGTLVTMFVFTWITAKTLLSYNMKWLEDHEKLITGVGLLILALCLFIIEQSHLII